MRSLLGRTAMAQEETLHPIHAVPAGKPMRRRVTRVASVALALHGSSTITMVRNPRPNLPPRRCAHCSTEQRWAQEETLHPIHAVPAGKPICHRVPRVASVGIGRPRPVRKPRNLDNAKSSLEVSSRRCAHCSAEQRWAQEETQHPIYAVPAGKPMCCRVPRVAAVGIALRGECVGAVRWRKGLFRCLQ